MGADPLAATGQASAYDIGGSGTQNALTVPDYGPGLKSAGYRGTDHLNEICEVAAAELGGVSYDLYVWNGSRRTARHLNRCVYPVGGATVAVELIVDYPVAVPFEEDVDAEAVHVVLLHHPVGAAINDSHARARRTGLPSDDVAGEIYGSFAHRSSGVVEGAASRGCIVYLPMVVGNGSLEGEVIELDSVIGALAQRCVPRPEIQPVHAVDYDISDLVLGFHACDGQACSADKCSAFPPENCVAVRAVAKQDKIRPAIRAGVDGGIVVDGHELDAAVGCWVQVDIASLECVPRARATSAIDKNGNLRLGRSVDGADPIRKGRSAVVG